MSYLDTPFMHTMTEDEVIATRNPYEIYQFARKNRSNERIESALIEINNPYFMYYTACYAPSANKERLGKAIGKSNNPRVIEQFIKLDISPNLKSKLEKRLTLAILSYI